MKLIITLIWVYSLLKQEMLTVTCLLYLVRVIHVGPMKSFVSVQEYFLLSVNLEPNTLSSAGRLAFFNTPIECSCHIVIQYISSSSVCVSSNACRSALYCVSKRKIPHSYSTFCQWKWCFWLQRHLIFWIIDWSCQYFIDNNLEKHSYTIFQLVQCSL